MNSIEKAIKAYDQYCDRLSSGFLNAPKEGGLTAGMALSNSKISSLFMTSEIVSSYPMMLERLESLQDKIGDSELDLSQLLKVYPEMREPLTHMELFIHEAFHGFQKHAYRSVFSLAEYIQSIESWENMIFFMHASSGKRWKWGGSFLSPLDTLDPSYKEGLANFIEERCSTFLEATKVRSNGMGLLHLIEAQALIASQVSVGAFGVFPLPDSPIYTAAWNVFKEAGGENPLVFILIISASLRFGEIVERERGSLLVFIHIR